jgi:hypothetical protein
MWKGSHLLGVAFVSTSNHEALLQDRAESSKVQFTEGSSVLDTLTATLQIAIEAAVFPNRFEIDEQEPLSRLEALTEQLLHGVNSLPNGTSQPGEVASRSAAISIISEVSKRIRATIQ